MEELNCPFIKCFIVIVKLFGISNFVHLYKMHKGGNIVPKILKYFLHLGTVFFLLMCLPSLALVMFFLLMCCLLGEKLKPSHMIMIY